MSFIKLHVQDVILVMLGKPVDISVHAFMSISETGPLTFLDILHNQKSAKRHVQMSAFK